MQIINKITEVVISDKTDFETKYIIKYKQACIAMEKCQFKKCRHSIIVLKDMKNIDILNDKQTIQQL